MLAPGGMDCQAGIGQNTLLLRVMCYDTISYENQLQINADNTVIFMEVSDECI